jgi:uncharacterized protein
MFPRHILPDVQAALQHTRVLLINGARQTGKTTLVKALIERGHRAEYITLDDVTILQRAKADPQGFIRDLTGPVILDEVQRAPEIFLPIKMAVDEKQQPGQFVLTGSANVLTLPRLGDSLAGRMEILPLMPLSQGELEGQREQFLDWVCGETFQVKQVPPHTRAELWERLIRGGYPEVQGRDSQRGRESWFASYVTTLVERDLRDLSQIRDLHDFPRLIDYLATRSATLLNLSEVSRSVGIQHETLRRYTALLEAMYLLREVPAWTAKLGKRLVKTPKIILSDTGLIAARLGITEERLPRDPLLLGQMLETFVVLELLKQQGWNETQVRLYHFRDHNGVEVDIVLELPGGDLVGIEIKATATPGSEDLSGLRKLQSLTGNRFKRGILLHTGTVSLGWGNDLYMLPIAALWR